jgi:hypothetical protein
MKMRASVLPALMEQVMSKMTTGQCRLHRNAWVQAALVVRQTLQEVMNVRRETIGANI